MQGGRGGSGNSREVMRLGTGLGCGSWAGPGLRGRETRVLTALQSSAWAAQGRWLSCSELAQQAPSLSAARATVHLAWGSRLTETKDLVTVGRGCYCRIAYSGLSEARPAGKVE